MRTRRIRLELGSRLAIGFLGAVWLWNLTIVSNNLLHHEQGEWRSIFPAVSDVREQTVYGDPTIQSSENQDEMEKSPSSPEAGGLSRNSSSLPPSEHRVPAFIILGAQKAGTQALRSYMWQHPQVHFSKSLIESHFFDWGWDKETSHDKNLEAYAKMLRGKKGYDCRLHDCITGESTPSYLFATKRVPSRIKKVCPWAKFIVVLRDPVKRAFSQCNMLIEKHEVKTSFEEHLEFDRNWTKQVGLVTEKAISNEEEDKAWDRYQKHRKARKMILARGLYEIQLRKWFEYFPREQFLILRSEELDFNRTATMSRVFAFLGLHDQPLEKNKKVHKKKYTTTMSDATRHELYDFYRPYNQRLERLLGPEWKDVWEEPA